MRQKEIKFEPDPSSKDYLLALAKYPRFTKLLDSNNKPYERLLLWMVENEKELLDENVLLPSIKELAKKSQVEYSKIAKQLQLIYNEIHELNNNFPNRFIDENQKLCYLTFEYLGNFASFNLGLDIIPKVGESFDFSFIKPKSGGDYFTVRNVSHSIVNGKQDICIGLNIREHNLYLQLLKEKAYLHKRISFMDYIGTVDSEFEKELLGMYKEL